MIFNGPKQLQAHWYKAISGSSDFPDFAVALSISSCVAHC